MNIQGTPFYHFLASERPSGPDQSQAKYGQPKAELLALEVAMVVAEVHPEPPMRGLHR